MSLHAVLCKKVELSDLPVSAIKARRIFILADGKRSLSQIFRLCRVDEDEGAALVKILLDEGCISVDEEAVPAREGRGSSSEDVFSVVEVTEKLSTELAKHIGPIAGILVKRAVLPEDEISKGQLRKVVDTLAGEIESSEDRQLFREYSKESLMQK